MLDQKLRLFCIIAEEESFSKAGEIVGISQPGVSRQIRALEESYGAKLFRRSGGKVRLTDAGESLLKYARKINAHFNAAKNEINLFIDPTSEVVQIGSCHIIGNYVLPDCIAQFNRKYKDIKMELIIDESNEIIDALHNKRIDIGIVEGRQSGSRIMARRFCTDRMVVIMPPRHKWSKKKTISAFDLLKEPIILREQGSKERELLEQCLSQHGIPFDDCRTVFVTGATESVKNAVEKGLGLSFTSQWAVRKECSSGRLKQVLMKDIGEDQEYSLVYRKNEDYSRSAAKFLDFIMDNPVNAAC